MCESSFVTCSSVSRQLLWEEERKELALTEKQTFIDLGCGNGLLVYILSSEGVKPYMKSMFIAY